MVLVLLATFTLLLCFIFTVFVQDLLHFFDCLLVSVIEDLFSSSSNDLLEHLLFFFEQEFEPEAFTLWNNLNLHLFVNFFVLSLNELTESFGLVVESKLPSHGLQDLIHLLHDNKDYSKDDKVE